MCKVVKVAIFSGFLNVVVLVVLLENWMQEGR